MVHPALHVGDRLPGLALEPAPVEVLGHRPELDDEVAGEVLGLRLPALLLPEPQQGCFVVAHDNPSVRASNKRAAALLRSCPIALRSYLSPPWCLLAHFEHQRRLA